MTLEHGTSAEVKFGSRPWTFQDLFEDVVKPASSYRTEKLLPPGSDAASAAAQIVAFAAGGVHAAMTITTQHEKELGHSTDEEAPPHALYPSDAGHTPTPSDDEDGPDAGTSSEIEHVTGRQSSPPARQQETHSTEALGTENREDQEKEDGARP